jgi:hypothetical protein|uniref:Uncharacterized protein n=1 Tax=Zea mays TaxID=4577 RepID=C4J3U0_MAIZE|nr:unknown [Zea mays]ACR36610.1 unknown [Zea mays]
MWTGAACAVSRRRVDDPSRNEERVWFWSRRLAGGHALPALDDAPRRDVVEAGGGARRGAVVAPLAADDPPLPARRGADAARAAAGGLPGGGPPPPGRHGPQVLCLGVGGDVRGAPATVRSEEVAGGPGDGAPQVAAEGVREAGAALVGGEREPAARHGDGQQQEHQH